LAVLSPPKWALLREALGDAAGRIRYLERDSVYTRPEAALAHYDAVLRRVMDEGAPAVRLIGELPQCKSQAQCDPWELYEAVLNRAFADRPVSILCGFDVREQPAAAAEAAHHTHPEVLTDCWRDNPRYQDPAEVVGALTPHPDVLPELRELPVVGDSEELSARLRREMRRLRATNAQAEKLLLAAAEVFDNAAAHGDGARSQRLGRISGRIVWELSDNGPGFDDPLAGYVPPLHDSAKGRGLWAVRQLTHRLEFLASPQGLTTRLWV
jgi:anti-sigma regulatory factor (Ser/Thr protein kinase)